MGSPTFSTWQHFLLLAGRILLSRIFVESGFRKLTGMDAFIASLVRRSVPYPTMLGWIGAIVEFLGGAAILLGVYARCAAVAIIVFVIIATSIGHRYWEIADAAARRVQQVNFAKNITIIGGLILLLVTGAGRLSIDGWRRRG